MRGYQLKITIKGSSPPIWRRVIVPEKLSFGNLDKIIQFLFGWTHSHLYCFKIPKKNRYFSPDSDFVEEDAEGKAIDEWFQEKAKIEYVYDYGDDWKHEILVEKIVDYDSRFPKVVKYKGPNMIEHCGGIWGFYEVIDQAEAFDMETANLYMEKHMIFPEFQEEDEDMYWEEEGEESFFEEAKIISMSKEETFLKNIFEQYTKDNLATIARDNGFIGYGRLKKDEMIERLVNQLLDDAHMTQVLMDTEEEELGIFQEAMGEPTYLDEYMVSISRLFSFYCGYTQDGLVIVPKDVEKKFKKLYNKNLRLALTKKWELMDYCRSAIYLYGLIGLKNLAKIYKKYENASVKEEEFIQAVASDEEMMVKDGCLMDVRLGQLEAHKSMLAYQEKHQMYVPETKEEFLSYGRLESQEPNQNTQPMIDFLVEKIGDDYSQAMMEFYFLQEMLRDNYSNKEIADIILSGKKGRNYLRKSLEREIRHMRRHIRTWQDLGFTQDEIERAENQRLLKAGNVMANQAWNQAQASQKDNLVSFPTGKKIYPNDPCPCGSGKKYKHCCGKCK